MAGKRLARDPRQRKFRMPLPHGHVYALWAERTTRVKIGFSYTSVGKRARTIELMSPLRLRVIGDWPGTIQLERRLHSALARYRHHGEWFDLPEDAVWWLIRSEWHPTNQPNMALAI